MSKRSFSSGFFFFHVAGDGGGGLVLAGISGFLDIAAWKELLKIDGGR